MKLISHIFFYNILFLSVLCNLVNSELLQYFQNVGSFFGYGKKDSRQNNDEMLLSQNVPYEVAVADEKFISEAAKLTGVALSDLDSCQHRVVLKLQTSCDRLNDEQIAKLAVMLLNCQSFVEGRKIYPCTDSMSIKDCTSSMDADTWNSYHLMSNRARAVCYSVRQIQFRGLTEHTINRLMDASRNQLVTLDKIGKDQKTLYDVTRDSLSSVSESQKELAEQQKDLQMAQLHGQLALEDNIKRISEEKRLILETHNHFKQMTMDVQKKLEDAQDQLQSYTDANSDNHRELIDDLVEIQNQAQTIFKRIDDSSKLLLRQSEIIQEQYESTVTKLAEVNATVYYLVSLVAGTKMALEEHMQWLNSALGGTDLALEKLYVIMWHFSFMLISMIVCAFLNAATVARLVVTVLPTLNLILKLQHSVYAFEFVQLCITVGSFILCHILFLIIMTFKQGAVPRMIKEKPSPEEKLNTVDNHKAKCDQLESDRNSKRTTDYFDFESPLCEPYLSRPRSKTPSKLNGISRILCGATTRMGTPCKLSTLPGRDFCHRHLSGDSIFAG